MHARTARRGMTLIEVMVALSLVAVATLALVSANTVASRATSSSYRHHVAMRLAQQRLDALLLSDNKSRLRTGTPNTLMPDGTALDCTEAGKPKALCDGALPDQVGWVDIYGRPCKRKGTEAEGYHPTCQYRRWVRYQVTQNPGPTGDEWRIFVVVSHNVSVEKEGSCDDFDKGDQQCVVTSAILTR